MSIIFWFRSIKVNGKTYYPKDLFRGEMDHKLIRIYEEENLIQEIAISDIELSSIKMPLFFTSYKFRVIFSLCDKSKMISLEPENPIYPYIKTNKNYQEAKFLFQALSELRKANTTSVDANPYIRNKKNIQGKMDKQILENTKKDLPPGEFYKLYIKSDHQLAIVFATLVPGILIILLLIIKYFFV